MTDVSKSDDARQILTYFQGLKHTVSILNFIPKIQFNSIEDFEFFGQNLDFPKKKKKKKFKNWILHFWNSKD